MSIWDDMNREQSARSLAAVPFRRAAGEAGARAIGDAATLSQASGNPFLAQRQGAMAAAQSQAPILAQMAAAQNQAAQRERDIMRMEQEQRQLRADRFLGAGLSAGGAGLGMLLQAFGAGNNPQAGMPAGSQPIVDAPQPDIWGPGGAGTGAAMQPQPGAPAQQAAPPMAQEPALVARAPAPTLPDPSSPASSPMGGPTPRPVNPVVMPMMARMTPDEEARRRAAQQQQGGGNGFGQTMGQLGGLASLVPGYGTLIGAGLNGLGSLFGRG